MKRILKDLALGCDGGRQVRRIGAAKLNLDMKDGHRAQRMRRGLNLGGHEPPRGMRELERP
jgi:hypothetical protein